LLLKERKYIQTIILPSPRPLLTLVTLVSQ
jgi:hypothetical protein